MKIIIHYSVEWQEYKVPGLINGAVNYKDRYACYTNDKADAIGTAQHIFGADVQIKIKRIQEVTSW